ncbi:putative Myosin heavy chain-like protein [Quillaja saponaria]|uniref:Myosin heavy chain-like protein n=1 Tax=Quillaja saponaria TaxID=32244 RepID=A0AAD7Q508_QUISA|nr:putative Myosin heavy chain-like protein [Quillaja saponaria]
MYLEKTVEVQNLQTEIAHLNNQISATHDEKERTASDAVLEVYALCTDKVMLEAALQEVQEKIKFYESNLEHLQTKSEANGRGLTEELTATKKDLEALMANHEKVLMLLGTLKSNEAKSKSIIRGLELELKASEFKRLQVEEEMSNLVGLMKTEMLQDEILALKKSLIEAKFENRRLEASFQTLSGDYEEQKVENISNIQRISSMQKDLSELEDYKRSKVALEDKVLGLEWDLTARESSLCLHAEMNYELVQIRRANIHFQRKIQCLEDEKVVCLEKVKTLKEELKQKKDVKLSQNDESKLSEVQMKKMEPGRRVDSIEKLSVETDQLQQPSNSQDKVVLEQYCDARIFQLRGTDPLSKIQFLENELADSLRENDMFKSQLKSMLSGKRNDNSDSPEKLPAKEESVNRTAYEQRISSLENEFTNLSERYLNMSLKYADVESQHDKLVLQLKSFKNGRN